MDHDVNVAERGFLPQEDYDKNGQVKRVRGRVLKALLKYEYRELLPKVLLVGIILFSISIFLFLMGILMQVNPDRFIVYFILMAIPFVYGALFAVIFPIILAQVRYRKNLFGKQGYLTLSIPATAEEHFLAKRISGAVVTLISLGFALFSLFFGVSSFIMLGEGLNLYWQGLLEAFTQFNFLSVLTILETLILMVEAVLVVLSVLAFFSCWKHRGMRPWMVVLVIVGAYFTFIALEFAFVFLFDRLLVSITPLVLRIFRWVAILLNVLLIWLFARYEINTLKHKINLK